MTKHVGKGANRPAHAARTARAAQRTPLPPKGATRGVERTAVKTIKEEVAKSKAAKTPAAPKAEYAKAAEFAKAVIDLNNGWVLKKSAEGQRAEVTGTRGDESFHIAWVNNVYERWAGYTGFGAEDKRVPNAKSMIVLLTRTAAEASAAPAPRAKGAPGAPRPAKSRVDTRVAYVLPWDSNTPDEEVLAAVKGRSIGWKNTLSIGSNGEETEGALQEARVPASDTVDGKKVEPRHLKVERNKNGDRIISFAAVEGQFRSVNEKSILFLR